VSLVVPYAVVPAGRLPPPAGATGREVSLVTEGSLGLLYEERERPPARTRDEMVAFAQLVGEIAASGPALPVRYGTVLDGLAEARTLLLERAPQWHDRLSFVADHVELLVHVYDDRAPRPSAPAPGSGREYLLSRAAARRHADALYDGLAAALAPHCRDVRRLRGSDEVRAACLVAADATVDLREALESWAAAQQGTRVTTTGPWPPFTFAEEDQP
jgi:hypothetical protein